MGAPRWPKDVRERALSLYPEHGSAVTARILAEEGHRVPANTVAVWASRADQVRTTSERTRAATAVSNERWALRRVRLADELGEIAEMVAAAMRVAVDSDQLSKARDGAGSLAILIDKAQLLSGDPTRRTETIGTREALAFKANELDELARRRQARAAS